MDEKRVHVLAMIKSSQAKIQQAKQKFLIPFVHANLAEWLYISLAKPILALFGE